VELIQLDLPELAEVLEEIEFRSTAEVSPQDFLEPVIGVKDQAEEVQIAL